MSAGKFTMTYEIITPESAEHGDVAEHGFYEPGGWEYPFPDDLSEPVPEPVYIGLREALRDLGCLEPNDTDYLNASWWSEIEGRTNYRTGAETRKSIHLPRNITTSSRHRVNRLIKTRQW